MTNSSGQGAAATVPAEINHWNWGAFLLNWVWGIGNNTYIALLMFIPIVNVVMLFVLAVKGSEWAWRNKTWQSVEHFQATQRKWARAGVIVFAACCGLVVLAVYGVMSAIKSSEPFRLALAKVEASAEASAVLGKPVSTGMPSGSIETTGPTGSANLSFSIEGPRGAGTVFVDAVKELGQWRVDRLVLQEDGSGRRIDLMPGG